MQTVRIKSTGTIEIVDNNTAHSLIEDGLAELLVDRKESKKHKDKMQKTYRNKGY